MILSRLPQLIQGYYLVTISTGCRSETSLDAQRLLNMNFSDPSYMFSINSSQDPWGETALCCRQVALSFFARKIEGKRMTNFFDTLLPKNSLRSNKGDKLTTQKTGFYLLTHQDKIQPTLIGNKRIKQNLGLASIWSCQEFSTKIKTNKIFEMIFHCSSLDNQLCNKDSSLSQRNAACKETYWLSHLLRAGSIEHRKRRKFSIPVN